MKKRASICARFALVVVLAAAIGLTNTRPASAKGSWLIPVKDRYEPGEVATLVAYTAGSIPERRAFRAYLRAAPQGATGNSALLPTDLPVGQLTVQESGHGGYLSLRVSLSFRIPQHLAPGEYELPYCDDPCTNAVIGDLTQGLINIGIPPRYPITRHWALDETEIANLAPEAQIAGPWLPHDSAPSPFGAVRPAALDEDAHPSVEDRSTNVRHDDVACVRVRR